MRRPLFPVRTDLRGLPTFKVSDSICCSPRLVTTLLYSGVVLDVRAARMDGSPVFKGIVAVAEVAVLSGAAIFSRELRRCHPHKARKRLPMS